MMKKSLKILIFSILTLFFMVGVVSANEFSFVGIYQLWDENTDGFSEKLELDLAQINILTYDPLTDNLFNDPGSEYLELPDLTLDKNSFVSNSSYDFDPNLYAQGFKLFDDSGILLFSADLTVDSLIVDGSTGYINPAFEMNLTNITADLSYVPGTSVIVDTFLSFGGGTNVSLQLPDPDLAGKIENGQTVLSTYSGSAAAAVPEPTTMLLFGIGLLGLGGLGRKKLLKR